MGTKDLILDHATNLFNQFGTAKVSTNHIAEAAGISPGNLYYHFENKAHIIREIYEQMIITWETPYERIENKSIRLEGIKRFVEDNFELLWKYRFFYRETVALMKDDPLLAERHASVTVQRLERQRTLLRQLENAGILQFPEPAIQLEDILTISWIVANHFLIHLESQNRSVEYRDFEEGAELVLKIFYPYLSQK